MCWPHVFTLIIIFTRICIYLFFSERCISNIRWSKRSTPRYTQPRFYLWKYITQTKVNRGKSALQKRADHDGTCLLGSAKATKLCSTHNIWNLINQTGPLRSRSQASFCSLQCCTLTFAIPVKLDGLMFKDWLCSTPTRQKVVCCCKIWGMLKKNNTGSLKTG